MTKKVYADTEYNPTSPKAQRFTETALKGDIPVYTGSALLKIKDKRIENIIKNDDSNKNKWEKREGIFAFNVSKSSGSKSKSLIKLKL